MLERVREVESGVDDLDVATRELDAIATMPSTLASIST